MCRPRVVLLLVAAMVGGSLAAEDRSEEAAVRYLEEYNRESGRWATELAHAEWDYESNLTEEQKDKKVKLTLEHSKWLKKCWQETIKFPWKTFKNETLKRQFKKASSLGTSALPDEKVEKFEKIVSEMQATYSTAKICDYHDRQKCDLSLDLEISDILAKSRDPEELKYVWLEWRKATGRKCKHLYEQYAEYCREAAKLNNLTDFSDYWNSDFESETFEEDVLKLWTQVEPLYQQFHAYVRRRLFEKYGESVMSRTGPIPAHLLGDMWGQSWSNIYDITAPFHNRKSPDITEEMQKQNYTVQKMFRLAENFFQSLNFSAMPEIFWKNSILEKIEGRKMVCHASAWDFFDGKDFRIKMCTNVNMEDLFTIHHEMGHIQYYLEYKEQPVEFREGANSGFHEAVGDLIFLSAATRKNLYRLGLLKGEEVNDDAQEINTLFQRALEKVAFLPFGLLVDLFRWNIFKGLSTPATYNQDWWFLKVKYQGIEPPADRDELDFDPGAKYHISGNVPYIRYFVSYIIQFQFHRALCIEAGQFNPNDPNSQPLHECNIYNSTKAGNLLKKMLQMGSSRPWPDAMEVLTGQRYMDGQAILEFFKPLHDWLKQENEKTGEKIGWDCSKRIALPNSVEASGSAAPSTVSLSTFLFSISILYYIIYFFN